MFSILLVVSSNDRLGAGGGNTGTWLEELAAAYYVFIDAQCSVTLASPKGGPAAIDPLSLEEPWLTEQGKRFQADSRALSQLENTLVLEEVPVSQLDAVYLVGGAATAWDFPANERLADIVQTLYAKNRPVCGVCHGVLGLTKAVIDGGRAIVAGKNVTGVSNAEEIMTGFDQLVPILPEDCLTALGGNYTCAAPLQAHVVVDGNLLTGQNPASAAPLAKALLARLEG